jgi:hypothetical protein
MIFGTFRDHAPGEFVGSIAFSVSCFPFTSFLAHPNTIDRIKELGLQPLVQMIEVVDKEHCPHIDTIVTNSLRLPVVYIASSLIHGLLKSVFADRIHSGARTLAISYPDRFPGSVNAST